MRSFFVGFTLLVAGVTIGFVLARSLEVGPAADEVVREIRAAEPAHGERDDRPLEPVAPVNERAPGTAATAIADDALHRSLVEIAELLPRPAGDGVIGGRVVDDSGAPVADATVVITGPYESRGGVLPTVDSSRVGRAYDEASVFNPMARMYATQVLQSLRPAGRAQTGTSGKFAIEAVAPGTYSANAFAEGFVFEPTQATPGTPLEFVGRAVTTFMFDVALPDGSMPPEATLVLRDPGRAGAQYLWTPSTRELRVASTRVTVQALVGDALRVSGGEFRADGRSPIRSFDIEVDGSGPHLLEVVQYPSVHVEVVLGPGADPSIEPWCELVRGTQTIPIELQKGEPFVAHDVTAGPYTVAVGRGDGPPEVTRDIVVDTGRTDVRVELGALDSKRFLAVHCVDWKGNPVQDVWSFGVAIRSKGGSVNTSIKPVARAGGEYLLSLERGSVFGRRHAIERASIETLELSATSRGMGDVSVDVDPAATSLEITFEPTCELLVEATGSLDPQLEAFVEFQKEDGQWRMRGQRTKLPGDGSMAFTGLPPGLCRVVVKHNDFRRRERLVEVEIELSAGANDVQIDIPAAHDLVVLVPDMGGERFQLRRESGGSFERSQQLTADTDERLVFFGLPPGLYQISRRAGLKTETMEVVVPCGEVVFEPMPVGGYEIVELPAGCPAARLGLQLGDVLVKVDGIDANTERFLVEFTSRTMRDEGAMLVVRRAGSLIELPARFEDDRPERGILGHGARFKAQLR